MTSPKVQTIPLAPVPTTIDVLAPYQSTVSNDQVVSSPLSQPWMQWFNDLRVKVNTINANLSSWSGQNPVTGIAPGTYGDASHFTTFTVNNFGQITAAVAQGFTGATLNQTTLVISSTAGVVTLDLSLLATLRYLTLTENVTSWVITNPPASGSISDLSVEITQGAGVAYTCVSPAAAGSTVGNYPWAVSTTLGAVERLGLSVTHAGVVSMVTDGRFNLVHPNAVASASHFGTPDGVTSAFQLADKYGCLIVTNANVTAMHRTDWQGRQLLSATARTNDCPASENFTTWQHDGLTMGVTDPIFGGAVTLTQGIESAGLNGGGGHKFYYSPVAIPAAGVYTRSFLAMAGTRTSVQMWEYSIAGLSTLSAFYDLTTGIATGDGNPWMVNLGSGIWRCCKNINPSASGSMNVTIGLSDGTGTQGYNGDGVSYAYIGASQVESGSIATPYIYTTATAVTVTDYTYTPSGVATMGQIPGASAVLDWDGSGLSVG